jgi:hypothetical protein
LVGASLYNAIRHGSVVAIFASTGCNLNPAIASR